MKGMNKVILIGNAGKDPEYKTLQDGTPVAKITVATICIAVIFLRYTF